MTPDDLFDLGYRVIVSVFAVFALVLIVGAMRDGDLSWAIDLALELAGGHP